MIELVLPFILHKEGINDERPTDSDDNVEH